MNNNQNIQQSLKKTVVLLSLMIVFCIPAFAQPNTTFSKADIERVRDFSGMKWKFKMMLPGQGVKQGLYKIPSEDIETLVWNNARVPGDVYTDLWKAGVIDDQYFGRNSVRAQWVQHYEWRYSIQFDMKELPEDEMLELLFEGVDYSCEVRLNGHYLGNHAGVFSKFSFDVTQYLRTHPWDAWKDERVKQENDHGRYGSYYHFFKEFTGQDGAKYDSQTQTPRAIGYE